MGCLIPIWRPPEHCTVPLFLKLQHLLKQGLFQSAIMRFLWGWRSCTYSCWIKDWKKSLLSSISLGCQMAAFIPAGSSQSPDLNRLPDIPETRSGCEILQWRKYLLLCRWNRICGKSSYSSSFKSLVWLKDCARLPLNPLGLNTESQNRKSRRTHGKVLTSDCSQKWNKNYVVAVFIFLSWL